MTSNADKLINAWATVEDQRARIERLEALVRSAHKLDEDDWGFCACGVELSCTACRDIPGVIGRVCIIVDGDTPCNDRDFWLPIHTAHVDALLNPEAGA